MPVKINFKCCQIALISNENLRKNKTTDFYFKVMILFKHDPF